MPSFLQHLLSRMKHTETLTMQSEELCLAVCILVREHFHHLHDSMAGSWIVFSDCEEISLFSRQTKEQCSVISGNLAEVRCVDRAYTCFLMTVQAAAPHDMTTRVTRAIDLHVLHSKWTPRPHILAFCLAHLQTYLGFQKMDSE